MYYVHMLYADEAYASFTDEQEAKFFAHDLSGIIQEFVVVSDSPMPVMSRADLRRLLESWYSDY
jgi:hypothetical protein